MHMRYFGCSSNNSPVLVNEAFTENHSRNIFKKTYLSVGYAPVFALLRTPKIDILSKSQSKQRVANEAGPNRV